MSDAIELLKAECNRYVSGVCSTRRCVLRGMERAGKKFPLTDYEVATCEHHEAVQEVDRLRELVSCLVENDPNDYAADAVTVLDVWRKDAREALKPKRGKPGCQDGGNNSGADTTGTVRSICSARPSSGSAATRAAR